jgi:hypothetical protein
VNGTSRGSVTDRRAPVALARHAPIAQPVVDLGLSQAALDQPSDGAALRLVHRETVEKPGIDFDAFACVSLARPIGRALNGLDDVESVAFGEIPVALILARHRHDRAGAVAQ